MGRFSACGGIWPLQRGLVPCFVPVPHNIPVPRNRKLQGKVDGEEGCMSAILQWWYHPTLPEDQKWLNRGSALLLGMLCSSWSTSAKLKDSEQRYLAYTKRYVNPFDLTVCRASRLRPSVAHRGQTEYEASHGAGTGQWGALSRFRVPANRACFHEL